MTLKATSCSCPNSNDKDKADRGVWFVERWANIYLKEARARLAPQLHGYDLSIQDVYTMQQLCAYEVSATPSNCLEKILKNARPSQLDFLTSVSCSLKMSGGALTTRELLPHHGTACFLSPQCFQVGPVLLVRLIVWFTSGPRRGYWVYPRARGSSYTHTN